MEDINRAVSALASLIAAHNKRIKAYQTLSEKSPREEIKSLCARYIGQSKQFVSNLSTWRSAYGGFAKSDDRIEGLTTWQQVRSLFGFSQDTISRLEQLELDTLKLYKSVEPNIPAATLADLHAQSKEIAKMLSKLQELKQKAQATPESQSVAQRSTLA